jgi:hypothetical protein
MKKYLISIFVVAAIATAAGWNVSRITQLYQM